ncbi:hypothetical protein B0J12DRAFT_768426 [Macrophomina phaseolina]|uniref:Uncharacterized protein n=1 Tax=Macrophomina phaseolina TaxID=35725 RepID=A0ABQ8FVV7_9PEZI|nr:hypothetical protein B0J12DRAFT_768426 [Macrophomina phaseolina]
MALSTASSILPLFNRSNTSLDASVPTHHSPTLLGHADSKRYLFPHLDSSEATPSENGSVLDARYAGSELQMGEAPRKRARSKGRSQSRAFPEQQWPSGSPNGPEVAVRFVNRPDATPLTTIIEQKSIATIRSARSLALAAHLTTSKPANHYAEETEQKQPGRCHTTRRQAALTIDEATLRELHEIIENQVPACRKVSSLSASECVDDVPDPARPISPPHSPPFRAQTPCGLSRQPGDSPTSSRPPRRRVSRARSFGNALRDFFRGPREELSGRNKSDHTTRSGAHEVPGELRLPRTNLSNHRTGLAHWRRPDGEHGTSNLPGCHATRPGMREVTAETDHLRDSSTPIRVPGTGERLHLRNEKRDGGSAQGKPLQPQDRQGPVQTPMLGPASPNVAQAGHCQVSRRPSTPSRQQERARSENDGGNESPNSVYSTPTRTGERFDHPLIPAPLFTSPPHSRRDLDPRIPLSSYDRLAHMLGSDQPPSRDKASQNGRVHPRLDTAMGYTAVDVPAQCPDETSLQSVDPNCADSRLIVPTSSYTPASKRASTAAVFSTSPHVSTKSVQGSCLLVSPPSSVFSTLPSSPVFPQSSSQPQTEQSKVEPEPGVSSSSTRLTVIRSAALPALLPIAAAEGIIRPRPLPRLVKLPLSDAEVAASPYVPRCDRRSSNTASPRISACAIRASGGSSASYHTAAQISRASRPRDPSSAVCPAPLSLEQALAPSPAPYVSLSHVEIMPANPKQRITGSSGSNEEKGVAEQFGWLLRVCFCQPLGGVEDSENGGDGCGATRKHRLRRTHRVSAKQGLV